MNYKLSSKKFIVFFFFVITIFILFHLIIWNAYTAKIFGRKDGLIVGDLGRLSYLIDSLHPRKTQFTLPKKHFHKDNWKNEPPDVITVGDSFSNGGGGGDNPYYQDFLATHYDINILNLHSLTPKVNPIDLIMYLYNTNWLQENKPKVVLIEVVERQALTYFGKEFDWDINNLEINSLLADAPKKENNTESLGFINDANYKILYYNYGYKKEINVNKNVFLFKLNKDLFANKNFANKLLIYPDDIKNVVSYDDERIEKLNNNFNQLSILLAKLDIKLFFMPAVDKYDLYSNYIENNSYQRNYFFDKLRVLDKQYVFVDTKNILTRLLENGRKDVYYVDDTHWTHNASKAISEDTVFNLIH